jgi:hypothetical protein
MCLPAGHTEHDTEPRAEERPSKQLRHSVCCVILENLFSGQLEHIENTLLMSK